MKRIVTFNANGIRSAAKKGFLEWMRGVKPDVVCLQELKAQEGDISGFLSGWASEGFHVCASYAKKRGYSGCALLSRERPLRVRTEIGAGEFDREGRFVEADFGAFSVVSVYFPSGTSSEERQEAKWRFLDVFSGYAAPFLKEKREVVFCGDFNIAHKEIDLKNWRGNLNHSGFLPEERAWMSRMLDSGWVDVFRTLDPRPERYTWWSQRGRARAKNVGWRIDYQVASPALAGRALRSDIYAGEKFSDHAPLIIDYSDEGL